MFIINECAPDEIFQCESGGAAAPFPKNKTFVPNGIITFKTVSDAIIPRRPAIF